MEVKEVDGDLNETIEVQSFLSPGVVTAKQKGSSITRSKNHELLSRCTSTPLSYGAIGKEFVSPVPNVAFDSGFDSFESDISRSTPIITRSRSRQWSGPALTSDATSSVSSSSAASSSKVSLISFDLRKFPSVSAKDQNIRKDRIIYRPGLFEHMEHLDIIKRLNDRGTMHILTNIWRHLDAEELGKAMQVSQVWNIAILSDSYSIDRYTAAKELAMDQNMQSSKQHVCSRLLRNSGPRKPFGSLNLIESPVKPREQQQQRRSPRLASSPNGSSKRRSHNELAPPQMVSPSKFRHKLFTEEAQRLGPDEKLQPCPRCTGPCRIIPNENKGLCSRISCQFHFCTLCNCLYHPRETPCRLVRGCKIKTSSPPSLSGPTKARVSSKQSKRRLKRL